MNLDSTMKSLVQISKARADGDEICITIIREPDVHIRVALSPENFTDTLLTSRKVDANIVRWRLVESPK